MPLNSFFDKRPIRWGIIGCGSVTEVKSGPAYQLTKDFEVRMVMRRDLEKAKDYAKRHHIAQATNDAHELIQDDAVDAVYVATPPDTHKQYALLVAEAGKPCCLEKPMAPSYKDCLVVFNAFKKRGLPLFVAHYRRSLPRFNKVKEWLDSGKIGEVRHLRWHLRKPPNERDMGGQYNWRTDPKIAPGGYFDDLASHGLDLFCYFFGKVVEVKGIATNQMGLYKAYDAISGSWRYENGVTGEGSWNFGANDRKDKVEIHGSRGRIAFSVFDETPVQLECETVRESLHIENPAHIQQYHVENIRKHLFGETEHPSLGKDGLHVAWVMDQILGKSLSI